MCDSNETNYIKWYRSNRIQICKDLHHWKYLTVEEKKRFKNSTDRNEIDRFMTTSRKRAADAESRKTSNM